MSGEETNLVEHYKLGQEISRDASTIMYEATDLRENAKVLVKLLSDQSFLATVQFRRAAKEEAKINPQPGEMTLLKFGCTSDGKFFTVYAEHPTEKLATSD